MDSRLARLLVGSAPHVLPVVVLVVLGLVAAQDRYWMFLATSAVIAYILTAGFNIIFGYAGIFALSHVALYGIAAYCCVYLEVQRGVPFWPAALVAVVFTGVVGALLALPTARLESVFMATATLGFAVAVVEVFGNWTSVTGGQAGIVAIPVPAFFGTDLLSGTLSYFWLCAAGALVAFQVSWRVHRSAMGRKLKALRESPRSLWAVGASPTTMRVVAFTLSSVLAGLAGVLYAHFQLTITPETFSFHRLIGLLLATIIGGAGTLLGPLLGVGVLVWVDEVGSGFAGSFYLIYGVAVVVLLAVGRNGVSGLVLAAWGALARRVRPPAPIERSEVSARGLGSVLDSVEGVGTLQARDIVVRFGGVTAVDHASLVVRPGEVVGLIGPNGAGKTSLVNAITGEVPVSAGTVNLGGTDVTHADVRKRVLLGLGRTFQSPHLLPTLTGLANVMLASEVDPRVGPVRQALDTPRSVAMTRRAEVRARALLESLGLTDAIEREAAALPYGAQRMVEIARNLAMSPRMLLLDEPGAGLTNEERDDLARIVREVADHGVGCLLIDHNMPLIKAACDRVVVMTQGRVLAEGSPEEILADERVVEAYLGKATA